MHRCARDHPAACSRTSQVVGARGSSVLGYRRVPGRAPRATRTHRAAPPVSGYRVSLRILFVGRSASFVRCGDSREGHRGVNRHGSGDDVRRSDSTSTSTSISTATAAAADLWSQWLHHHRSRAHAWGSTKHCRHRGSCSHRCHDHHQHHDHHCDHHHHRLPPLESLLKELEPCTSLCLTAPPGIKTL